MRTELPAPFSRSHTAFYKKLAAGLRHSVLITLLFQPRAPIAWKLFRQGHRVGAKFTALRDVCRSAHMTSFPHANCP